MGFYLKAVFSISSTISHLNLMFSGFQGHLNFILLCILNFCFLGFVRKIKELRTWCVYNVSGDGEQCWILDQEYLKNTWTTRNLYQAHNQRFIKISSQRPCLWVKTRSIQYLNRKLFQQNWIRELFYCIII